MAGHLPTFAQLRRLLSAVLRQASEFEAFCLDHFPEVHHKFSSAQGRVDKENILLGCVEPADLWAALCENHPDIEEHLAAIQKSSAASALRPLNRSEAKNRARYLRELREHLANLKKASIHRACFIDLSVEDDPSATRSRDPWIYRNPDSKREFDSVGAALDAYERRLLILGAPGAGKTTSLQHIAFQLLQEAEQDPEKPVPLLVNLSNFYFVKASASQTPSLLSRFSRARQTNRAVNRPEPLLERWLVQELAARARIGERSAERWFAEERVAVLLDGLDEVEDSRRVELARQINELFLADYPEVCVVVCSRIFEYEPLKENFDTQLQLEGAVTLQSLSPQQIDDYLTAAQVTGLKESLRHDEALRELAATPLTLSMMTLAYGGSKAPKIPAEGSLAEKRHRLMDAYVARMLQRKERRDRDRPFDEARKGDVPLEEYRYTPEQIDHRLGWLAIRMSVRMQTTCSLGRFYSFLSQQPRSSLSAREACAADFALSLFLVLALCAVAVPLLATTVNGPVTGVAVLGTAAAGFVGFAALGRASVLLSTLFWGLCISYVDGAIARAMSHLLPFAISPTPMGHIVIASMFTIFIVLLATSDSEWAMGLAFLGATVAALCITVLLARLLHISWGDWPKLAWLLAGLLVAAQCLCISALILWNEGWVSQIAMAIPMMGGVLGVNAGGVWLTGFLPGPTYLIAVAIVLAVVLIVEPTAYVVVLGFAVSSGLGAYFGRGEWAIVGAILFGLTAPLWGTLFKLDNLDEKLRARLNQWLLSPVLVRTLSVLGALPLRRRRFFNYCQQALLLKVSPTEIEFIHRLLRDYFALREIIPQLYRAEGESQLWIVRTLGYQGDAAIDTLAELSRDKSPEVRSIAIESLVRIASPAAEQVLEQAKSDPALCVQLTLLKVRCQKETAKWDVDTLSGILAPFLSEHTTRPEFLREAILTAKPLDVCSRIVYLTALVKGLPAWASELLPSFLKSEDRDLCVWTIKLLEAQAGLVKLAPQTIEALKAVADSHKDIEVRCAAHWVR